MRKSFANKSIDVVVEEEEEDDEEEDEEFGTASANAEIAAATVVEEAAPAIETLVGAGVGAGAVVVEREGR